MNRIQPAGLQAAPSVRSGSAPEGATLAPIDLLERAVALLLEARKGGWQITSEMSGDFNKHTLLVLRFWWEEPAASAEGET